MKHLCHAVAIVLIQAFLLPLSACSKPTDLVGTGSAHADSSLPASENAALRYWEAWWELGPDAFPSFFDRIRLIDTKTGEPVDQPEPEPISERGIKMLIAATEVPRCDFGVDLAVAIRGDSEETISGDHYWLLLGSNALLLREAEAKLDSGNPDRAAQLYLAALFMIDHAAQQPELATIGIPKVFTDMIDEIKEKQSAFPRPSREILGQAALRFDGEDPFRIIWGLHRIISASAESLRRGEIENENGLSPKDLDLLAVSVYLFMSSDSTEQARHWTGLEMDEQNPTRQAFEPILLGLREQQDEALQRLNWLREWSSQ